MADVTPGTTSNGTPAARSASGLLAAAAEDEGVAALEPHDGRGRRARARPARRSISSCVIACRPGALPASTSRQPGGASVEQRVAGQPVVHHDVGAPQQLERRAR